MAVFEVVTYLAAPVDTVWEFLTGPANLLEVSPPEFHLRLVEGPERLSLGARITVQGRRWAIPQKITNVVTVFEPPCLLVDQQEQGPFGKFVHTHQLEAVSGGTRMLDHIEYEAPTGLLGLVLTESRIRRDLGAAFAYRAVRFSERFGTLAEPKP